MKYFLILFILTTGCIQEENNQQNNKQVSIVDYFSPDEEVLNHLGRFSLDSELAYSLDKLELYIDGIVIIESIYNVENDTLDYIGYSEEYFNSDNKFSCYEISIDENLSMIPFLPFDPKIIIEIDCKK